MQGKQSNILSCYKVVYKFRNWTVKAIIELFKLN